MTWEWSHTAEAYADAEHNLHNLPVDELRIIWAEWKAKANREDYADGFDSDRYDAALIDAGEMNAEQLADAIWENASEQRDCSNGGHEAYMCPFGCGPHCVPFDRQHSEEQPCTQN